MINLAKNIKRIISINLAANNNQDLILQQLSLDNTMDILFSTQTDNNIVDINTLNDSILKWKRKEQQTFVMKRVINVYIFMHIVNILQLYEAVEKHKDQIQKIDKYKLKKGILKVGSNII